MKHYNGLKWSVKVILKPGLAFECLILKRSYKSHGRKTVKVLLYWNYALFFWVAKNFGKKLKHFIVLLYYFILLLKASVKQMTKIALGLGLGKPSIFVRYLERARNCIHKLIRRYEAIFYPCTWPEFIDEHGTSFFYQFYVNSV